MSSRERDRLKVLHEVGNGRTTQKQAEVERASGTAAGERVEGPGLCGGSAWSSRTGLQSQTSGELERRALEELSREECRDFGPTFAAWRTGAVGHVHSRLA